MTRQLFFLFIFTTSVCFAQNCPTRIGGFIINESSVYDLSKICDCNETANKIENGQDLINQEVEYDMIDLDYGITSSAYELKPDLEKINGWYNRDYASVSDSTRVFFIPYYKTENISIKNLLLKFKNDSLFYIKASISKDYFDILIEKYKGKGIETANKKTQNKCRIAKLRKYLDIHKELSFFSEIEEISAKISIDNIINSDCKFEDRKDIEIYNPKVYLKYLQSRNILLKKLVEEKIENDKKEKAERLKKF